MLLLVHAGLLAWSAYRHSPVIAEIGHLPAGLSHLEHGCFDLYRVNPPLVRMAAAMPARVVGAATDWSRYDPNPKRRSELPVGQDFLRANGSRSFRLFTLGRWACIPFGLLGGYVCYRWATQLYGVSAGLLALGLWCFSPTILGHASLLTPDAAAAAMGVLAGHAFWHWLKRSTWSQGLLAGMVLGLAELTKTTLLVLYPVLPAIWLFDRCVRSRGRSLAEWSRDVAMLSAMFMASLLVINTGYDFEGSLQKLKCYEFQSRMLSGEPTRADGSAQWGNRFAGGPLGEFRVPLPRSFVQGIDTQKVDFERKMRSYLHGEWRIGGWWYFYLYALAVKVPAGTWLLVVLAILVGAVGRGYTRSWGDELTVLLPAVTILIVVSSHTGFSIHPRYMLPALPFLFVWASKVGRAFTLRHRTTACVATLSFVAALTSSLFSYPHSLSYFNVAVAGPLHGPAHLVDSALGWGQDLLYLRRWLDQHPEARPLRLASFGHVDPRLAGIEFTLPPTGPPSADCHANVAREILEPGWYVVDVNYLVGSAQPLPDGEGGQRVVYKGGGDFRYFQGLTPVARVGYSMCVYHVPSEPASEIRHEPAAASYKATLRWLR